MRSNLRKSKKSRLGWEGLARIAEKGNCFRVVVLVGDVVRGYGRCDGRIATLC